MAALGGGVFAVLVRPGVDLVDLTPLLRREIDRRVGVEPLRSATRCPVRIRFVDVPRSPDDGGDLVMRLARILTPAGAGQSDEMRLPSIA